MIKTSENDWRLTGQEKFLKNIDLIKIFPNQFVKERNILNLHEHCEFCMTTINSDYLKACYVTKDLYHWICQDCFEDFKEAFNWRVVE